MSALFEDVWSGSQREELCVEEGAGDRGKGKPLDLDEKAGFSQHHHYSHFTLQLDVRGS